MALSWSVYLFVAGGYLGCLGIGIAWGMFRLSWKEVLDVSV